jgi:hypothetical protein
MSTTAENMQDTAQMDAWLNKKLDELLPKKLEEIESQRTPSMSIIATKGTLDWAYPPFILEGVCGCQPAGQPGDADEDAVWSEVVPGL